VVEEVNKAAVIDKLSLQQEFTHILKQKYRSSPRSNTSSPFHSDDASSSSSSSHSQPQQLQPSSSQVNVGSSGSHEPIAKQIVEPLRWRRGQQIGEGSFGKVFKGMNENTGELLAVKQLYLTEENSEEIDSLCREISVISVLHHLNIVK
jgi:hypothetical protein